MQAVVTHRGDALAITGPGAMAGALQAAGSSDGTIYNMELAYATAMAHGIALLQPSRRVIALEGDGSLVAGLGGLATIARYRPPNLVCLALVNGVYGTGDNRVPTQAGLGADLAAVACDLGWPPDRVIRAGTADELDRGLARAMTDPGPWFLAVAVDPASYGRSGARPRPGADVVESGILFRRYVEGTRG
jgi:thiamine pyrophosphate-dependent acetolactate synthase large subunit-like protein